MKHCKLPKSYCLTKDNIIMSDSINPQILDIGSFSGRVLITLSVCIPACIQMNILIYRFNSPLEEN